MRYFAFRVTYNGRDLGTVKTAGAGYKRVFVTYRDAINAGGFSWQGLKIEPIEVDSDQGRLI